MLRASSLSRRFALTALERLYIHSRCSAYHKLAEMSWTAHYPPNTENVDGGEKDIIRRRVYPFSPGRPWKTLPIPTVESGGMQAYQRRLDMLARENGCPTQSPRLQKVLGTYGTTSPKPSKECIHGLDSAVLPIDHRYYRKNHLRIIGQSQHIEEAWTSFSALTSPEFLQHAQESGKNAKIPLAHLHRLVRLLSRARPKTRTIFLRLLEVLRCIQTSGGTVHLHEWNALVDNSGKGWRKTRLEDFALALTVFNDMIAGNMAGSTLPNAPKSEPTESSATKRILPDIYTYNTLISIAAKTENSTALRQATELMLSAGLSPNRITHLSMLRFFVGRKQITGVRSTLQKMHQQGLDLGLDGLNGALWAFAHVERLDVVLDVYRVLRHNLKKPGIRDIEVEKVKRHLRDEEHIIIPPEMIPNEITFNLVVQIFAYHGDLIGALNVLQDMLKTLNTEVGAPLFEQDDGSLAPREYEPAMPVFRAIFLGYSRHAVPPTYTTGSGAAWNLHNLRALFTTFIQQPNLGDIPQSLVYWIMMAFSKTSGGDEQVLQEVWVALEEKFNGPWGTPKNRLQRIRKSLFPSYGPYEKLE